jgi:tetratricopeptide (TPR) repeat protein
MKLCPPILALIVLAAPARAGLHYTGEVQAELPASWRGFLLDHRALRLIGVSAPNAAPTLLREQYEQTAERLAKRPELTADEAADLGALYVRLGKPEKAVQVLAAATRKHPDHFRCAANLGTAWQLAGEPGKAAEALRDAVRLAPNEWKEAEGYHLKLVELRRAGPKNATELDDLFGVKYVGETGKPEPGKIAPAARQKLPANAAAIVQQLALWLPADGRLLWQLGEIANAHGDVRTAANILDGCVGEFALASPDARRRRTIYREAADAIARLPDSEHDKFRGDLKTKSPRPLLRKLDSSLLPPVRADGINALPWLVLNETAVARPFKPRFAKYLEDLDGKRVALTGFMQPADAETSEAGGFLLLENPVGCWFCESPEPAGIVYVALPEGKTTEIRKGLVKVEGVLRLNRNDPEQYLYKVSKAKVGEAD